MRLSDAGLRVLRLSGWLRVPCVMAAQASSGCKQPGAGEGERGDEPPPKLGRLRVRVRVRIQGKGN